MTQRQQAAESAARQEGERREAAGEAPEPGQDAAPQPSAKERMAAKLEGFFDREPPQEPEAELVNTPTRGMD